MALPVSTPYVQQEFPVMYLKLDGNLMTEVQSIRVTRNDGGADIATLVRGQAGRVSGAAFTDITFSGVVPYMPPDTGGEGWESGGMVTGKGAQIDQTMLSNLNANFGNNGALPVQFVVSLGNPAAQKLFFSGFVHTLDTDVSVGRQISFTATARGSFSTFVNS